MIGEVQDPPLATPLVPLVVAPMVVSSLQVFALLSVLCIMVAIVSFCMETLPAFDRPVCLNTTVDGGLTYFMRPNYQDPFFIVESV